MQFFVSACIRRGDIVPCTLVLGFRFLRVLVFIYFILILEFKKNENTNRCVRQFLSPLVLGRGRSPLYVILDFKILFVSRKGVWGGNGIL